MKRPGIARIQSMVHPRVVSSCVGALTLHLLGCGEPATGFTDLDAGRIDARPAHTVLDARPDKVAPVTQPDTGRSQALLSADAGTEPEGDAGPVGDVNVVLTCDNAYGFGWGTSTQMNSYFTSPAATLASEIFSCPIGNVNDTVRSDFGPEAFTIPAAEAPAGAYLYVVTWADESVTQGVIGQFKRARGMAIYTGDPKFDVCATGLEYNTDNPTEAAGPTTTVINQQIAVCNAGTGSTSTSSGGWVNSAGPVTAGALGALAVGQDNSGTGADFQMACQSDTGPDGGVEEGIDPTAHWMWYTPTPDAGDAFMFTTESASRQFLIFRLAAAALPPPPPLK
jgi:hypothetical protein